uniref:Uncharacterized protein n=1 Tax=Anguilla anguilla TaxID=7936 RepID=A0A0E9QDF9_ANGAN
MFLNALCAGCIVGDCSLHLLINLNLMPVLILHLANNLGKGNSAFIKKIKAKIEQEIKILLLVCFNFGDAIDIRNLLWIN